jgi:lysophospholipase L1-like esterase
MLQIGAVKIAAGSRLLFIGDSVTDCGRVRPIGTGPGTALGDGYVAQIDSAVGPVYPENPIRLINMGISGNTIRDLATRWDGDALALKPDWLSIMIGINDVWRQFDGIDPTAAVMPDEFERTYGSLVARTQPRLKGLVLMTPYYVQPLRTDPMRRRMDTYGAVTRKLAERHGALLVDTQRELDHALEANAFRKLAEDRVHPTTFGHGILARAFLRAIDVNPRSLR